MKPILFNTEMVRAILEGRKSVTRRVVKPKPEKSAHSPYECVGGRIAFRIGERGCTDPYKPPYRPGNILYVRETFWQSPNGEYTYKSDSNQAEHLTWNPSIHMPREAARLFLRVTDVRVERLQDITELDILKKEGVTVYFPQPKPSYMSHAYVETRLKPAARKAFADLWDSTIKPAGRALYGWDANPWVWVIEFERISKEDIPPEELAR